MLTNELTKEQIVVLEDAQREYFGCIFPLNSTHIAFRRGFERAVAMLGIAPGNEWSGSPDRPIQRYEAKIVDKTMWPVVVEAEKGSLVYHAHHLGAMERLLEEALGEMTKAEIDRFDPEVVEHRLVNAVLAARKLRLTAKSERVKIERSPGIPPRWIVLLDGENPFNGVFCREKDAERYAAGLRAELEKDAKP